MIKAIVLDIDGIVIGRRVGENFPLPSKKVTQYLRDLSHQGMPIILCTGKTSFTVNNIIRHIGLNNDHITDGGALIYNPIQKKVSHANYLDRNSVHEIIKKSFKYLDYWQIYTQEKKFTLKDRFPSEMQEPGMDYELVNSFEEIVSTQNILKIELIYTPEQENFYRMLSDNYQDNFSIQWTEVPVLLPNKIIIITTKGIEKKNSVDILLNKLEISRENVLAMGDTMMDWDFMNGSGYLGTLKNAKEEIIELVTQKKGFVGKHVDDDGLIEVLQHYEQYFSLKN